MFVYELSGCRFESISSHLNFIFCSCFKQGVSWLFWTYSQMYRTDKYSYHSSVIWPVWLNGWLFIYKLSGYGFEFSCSHLTSDFAPILSKDFLDIRATIECGFTLKRVRDMIRTYSEIHRTDKYSQHRSIIWLNGLALVYELSGCGFESSSSHLNLIFYACFQQGLPCHFWNRYMVW